MEPPLYGARQILSIAEGTSTEKYACQKHGRSPFPRHSLPYKVPQFQAIHYSVVSRENLLTVTGDFLPGIVLHSFFDLPGLKSTKGYNFDSFRILD